MPAQHVTQFLSDYHICNPSLIPISSQHWTLSINSTLKNVEQKDLHVEGLGIDCVPALLLITKTVQRGGHKTLSRKFYMVTQVNSCN